MSCQKMGEHLSFYRLLGDILHAILLEQDCPLANCSLGVGQSRMVCKMIRFCVQFSMVMLEILEHLLYCKYQH